MSRTLSYIMLFTLQCSARYDSKVGRETLIGAREGAIRPSRRIAPGTTSSPPVSLSLEFHSFLAEQNRETETCHRTEVDTCSAGGAADLCPAARPEC